MTDTARVGEGLTMLETVLAATRANLRALEPIVAAMRRCLANGGTLFFAGNGGSAADAQHLAAEYVVRYRRGQSRALRAIALTTDTSALTAAANDFGFDEVFARQVEALARPGDILIVHSTSGESRNCVVAVERARELGALTIGFLGGDGGALLAVVDHAFVVPSTVTNIVQEVHLALEHQIAGILTAEFAA